MVNLQALRLHWRRKRKRNRYHTVEMGSRMERGVEEMSVKNEGGKKIVGLQARTFPLSLSSLYLSKLLSSCSLLIFDETNENENKIETINQSINQSNHYV
jgi:hypothetical protein